MAKKLAKLEQLQKQLDLEAVSASVVVEDGIVKVKWTVDSFVYVPKHRSFWVGLEKDSLLNLKAELAERCKQHFGG